MATLNKALIVSVMQASGIAASEPRLTREYKLEALSGALSRPLTSLLRLILAQQWRALISRDRASRRSFSDPQSRIAITWPSLGDAVILATFV
jgi:hypothetical protein